MLYLRTFGVLDLLAGSADIPSVLAQPKRLGLLVYLATAGTAAYRRRDTILPLFWPELDTDHARAALRQAVYVLRRDLGESAVRARGEDELGVDPAILDSDHAQFLRLCEQGDHRAAMEAYRGDFLDGFFVGAASAAYDDWVASERARLRDLASLSAKAVAESEAASRPAEAAAWIRSAAALAPDDESTVRWALRLFDRIGDRAGALRLYREFRERLVREYDAQPSTETKAIVAGLRESVEPASTHPKSEVFPDVETRPAETAASPPRGKERRSIRWSAAAAGIVAVVAMAMMSGGGDEELNRDRIFALPLRVSTTDSSLNYLREGMLDLLAAKLAPVAGANLVDPGTAVRFWRRAGAGGDVSSRTARRLARTAGAGRFLLGSVVGDARRIDIQATVYDVATGRPASPVVVSGSPDSLPSLVDRLAKGLLLGASQEDERRLADLTSQSLPALQAYLVAKQAFRAGAHQLSMTQYLRAIELDSTFALAALALAESRDYWDNAENIGGRARRLAWANRDRLPPRDREFLQFLVQPNYPGPSTPYEKLASWERAARSFPDRPVAWYQYGDALFHWGLMLGVQDAVPRAAGAFDRAVALDSAFAPALEHRIWLAAHMGDRGTLARLGQLYELGSADAERRTQHRWRIAAGTGDAATLALMRSRFRSYPGSVLHAIANESVQDLVNVSDAESTFAMLLDKASVSDSRYEAMLNLHYLALERGQPERARAMLLRSRGVELAGYTDAEDRALIYDALYQEGSRAAADSAAASIGRRAARRLPREGLARARQLYDVCAVAQWRASGGDSAYARVAAATLEATRPPQDDPNDVAEHAVCAALVRLHLALATGAPVRAIGNHLDSMLSFGRFVYVLPRQASFLTLARAWEREGDLPRALATVRRRELGLWNRYISTRLREEGRLAVLVGDSVSARAAWGRYLALRSAPEAALAAEVRRIQEHRAALGSDAR